MALALSCVASWPHCCLGKQCSILELHIEITRPASKKYSHKADSSCVEIRQNCQSPQRINVPEDEDKIYNNYS